MQANEWQALLIARMFSQIYLIYLSLFVYMCIYVYIVVHISTYLVRLRWRCRGWGNLFDSEEKTLQPFVLCHHLIRSWVGKKGRVSSSPAPWYSSTPYTPYTHIGSPVFNFYLIAFVDSNCRSRIVLRLLFYSFVPCVFPILFHISAFYGASLSMWGSWGDRVTAHCTWWWGRCVMRRPRESFSFFLSFFYFFCKCFHFAMFLQLPTAQVSHFCCGRDYVRPFKIAKSAPCMRALRKHAIQLLPGTKLELEKRLDCSCKWSPPLANHLPMRIENI